MTHNKGLVARAELLAQQLMVLAGRASTGEADADERAVIDRAWLAVMGTPPSIDAAARIALVNALDSHQDWTGNAPREFYVDAVLSTFAIGFPEYAERLDRTSVQAALVAWVGGGAVPTEHKRSRKWDALEALFIQMGTPTTKAAHDKERARVSGYSSRYRPPQKARKKSRKA